MNASDADVAVAQTALRAADLNLKQQKSEWLPNISFGYRRNTEQREAINGFMVGVSFPLYSNSSNVKAARQRRQSAELQVTQAQHEAESSLRTSYEGKPATLIAVYQQPGRLVDGDQVRVAVDDVQRVVAHPARRPGWSMNCPST